MSASLSQLEGPSAPAHPKALKRNASLRQKRLSRKGLHADSRFSIILEADEEGPELISAELQIKEVVDEELLGTFTESGTYIPPGFEDATTIDGDSPT